MGKRAVVLLVLLMAVTLVPLSSAQYPTFTGSYQLIDPMENNNNGWTFKVEAGVEKGYIMHPSFLEDMVSRFNSNWQLSGCGFQVNKLDADAEFLFNKDSSANLYMKSYAVIHSGSWQGCDRAEMRLSFIDNTGSKIPIDAGRVSGCTLNDASDYLSLNIQSNVPIGCTVTISDPLLRLQTEKIHINIIAEHETTYTIKIPMMELTGAIIPPDEVCDDTIDNDKDLLTDCLDPDCNGITPTPTAPADCGSIAQTGIATTWDGSSWVSTINYECNHGDANQYPNNGRCCPVGTNWNGAACVLPTLPTNEICTNNANDDADIYWDCADDECYIGNQICTGSTRTGPGLDGNTYVCAGPGTEKHCCPDGMNWDSAACVLPTTPTPEICYNGVNDDADGLVDCEDPDCQFVPWSEAVNCKASSWRGGGYFCSPYDPDLSRGICCPDGMHSTLLASNILGCTNDEDCWTPLIDEDNDGFYDCVDPDCNGYNTLGEPTVSTLNCGTNPCSCGDSSATGTVTYPMSGNSFTFRCNQGQFGEFDNRTVGTPDFGGFCCPEPLVWNGDDCAPPIERCGNSIDDDGDTYADCRDPAYPSACYDSTGTYNAAEVLKMDCRGSNQTVENCWDETNQKWRDFCRFNFASWDFRLHCSDGVSGSAPVNLCCLAGQEIEQQTNGDWKCVNIPETICNDNKDNDRDGFADCLDNDCQVSPFNFDYRCRDSTVSGLDQDEHNYFCSDDNAGHSMCCPAGSTVESQLGVWICAVAGGTEVCYDGVDNNWDGLVDCADEDCAISELQAGLPKPCTNNWQISDAFCTTDANGIVDCDSVGGLFGAGSKCDQDGYNCTRKVSSFPRAFYCNYGADDTYNPTNPDDAVNNPTDQGYCCPKGTRAEYTDPPGPIPGTWDCVPTEKCYDSLDPLLKCKKNYETERSDWLQSTYSGPTDNDWCVDTVSPTNRACCPVIKYGSYTYWSDENNVKVY